ncbi:TraK domain-containing protein, partial [Vibrio crassostreae]
MNLYEQSFFPSPRWHPYVLSLAIWVGFFIPSFAQADNVAMVSYEFNEGDTIPLSLSSINVNRLLVKNDRIISIVCPKGFCTSTG